MNTMNTDGIIIKGVPDKLPPGAILISEAEAVVRQWDLLRSWTPKSDVWALRYGYAILSSAVGISALLITNYYRSRLKLGSFGRFTIQIPTVFVPSFVATVFEIKYVATPILLQNECPICVQLRSCAIQTMCGVVFPGILAPLASFGYAYNYGSYELPPLVLKNAKDYLRIYWKFTKKYQRTLGVMLAVNALLASYITYLSGSMFYQMRMKMLTDRAQVEEKVYGKVSNTISSKLLQDKKDNMQ